MAERPILFSAPMVRAILEGRKTQTRRVVKPQPERRGAIWAWWVKDGAFHWHRSERPPTDIVDLCCPYKVGGRLWVRETWAPCNCGASYCRGCIYRADGEPPAPVKWHPSIFMPRCYCRIILELTGIRLEQVQDISEEDAIAEGIEQLPSGLYRNYDPSVADFPFEFARTSFRSLWDSINAKRGCGWEANLWNWALTFKRVEVPA